MYADRANIVFANLIQNGIELDFGTELIYFETTCEWICFIH